MTSRPSTAAPLLTVLAIVLATLGAYVGGYFWLATQSREAYTTTDYSDGTSSLTDITRIFPHRWQAVLYRPASDVESWWRGIEVQVTDTVTWES